MIPDIKFCHDFIVEATEHLREAEIHIINMEQQPESIEDVNAILRHLHSIKGSSGFLHLRHIQELSHAGESLLEGVRTNRLRIDQGLVDLLLEALDILEMTVQDFKAHIDAGQVGHSSFDLEPYFTRVRSFQARQDMARQSSAEKVSCDGYGTSRPLLGQILSSWGIVSPEDVSKALDKQTGNKAGLRIGEILLMERKARPKEIVEALREQKRKNFSTVVETTAKVEISKMNALTDLVSRLRVVQSQIETNPFLSVTVEPKWVPELTELKEIVADLEKIASSFRRVPIGGIFRRMTRLSRDLAARSGKLVELYITGEEMEVDRSIADRLYDPLVHMVRNAIDHGIEPPEGRIKMGKPGTGRISLRACQRNGHMVIEIEDDGQGLDRLKILEKAKALGLLSGEILLKGEEVDPLIFEPGFSTADQATVVSGRGIGLDVVKTTIGKLKGRVGVVSSEGKGSLFILHIPLS